LDWDRIARGARLTESVLAVRETLQFLRDRLDVSLPAEAFTRLGQTPVSLYEPIESRVVRRPYRSLWDKLPMDLACGICAARAAGRDVNVSRVSPVISAIQQPRGRAIQHALPRPG
jgi:hypothetical protein